MAPPSLVRAPTIAWVAAVVLLVGCPSEPAPPQLPASPRAAQHSVRPPSVGVTSPPAAPGVRVQMSGHSMLLPDAILFRAMRPPRPGSAPQPTSLLFASGGASCARSGVVEFFEPHVGVHGLQRGDAEGRQSVRFELCVRTAPLPEPLDCRIQGDATLELEGGPRAVGSRVRGHVHATREPWVRPRENGVIEGTFEAIVCDAEEPAGGVQLVE